MKLENQVCTLEEGKALLELGICKDSLFCYIGDGIESPYRLMTTEYAYTEIGKGWYDERIPVFTAAELHAMVPADIFIGNWCEWRITKYTVGIVELKVYNPVHNGKAVKSFESEKLASCLAMFLHWILSEKYISVRDCNIRLRAA